MSSNLTKNRPPASFAARHASRAANTCPKCNHPVGLGANRVTTSLVITRNHPVNPKKIL
jgi:hypothetical protein